MLKVNNKNFRTMSCHHKETSQSIGSANQLTGFYMVARRRSGVFIVSFEHISHLFLVFLLLTLNK